MSTPNPHAMEFLLTRRSRPAKTLVSPAPNRAQLLPILTAAARSPDHGKLEPWRFIVLQGTALTRLAELVQIRGQTLEIDPDKIIKGRAQFDDAHLVVAVVSSPQVSDKIPMIEQADSAGAVCLSLLNGALASGWGANWLTGWASHDAEFRATGLGLAPQELSAGFIHVGSESSPPPDRPRPDIAAKTVWISA